MNTSGLVLIALGSLLITQLFFGDAIGRLDLFGSDGKPKVKATTKR